MYFAKDSDIVLFKTPLDSSYRNVYDDYSTTADYADFLDQVFGLDSISITLSNAKARQDRDGEFSLVIAGYDSMDLHDYNYLQFVTSNNQIKFAFITSVDSQSDGSAKSCVLHCKLDAWSNHYFEIRDSGILSIAKRCTYDDYSKRYLPSEVQKYNFKIRKLPMRSCSNTSADGRYTVLWQRIEYRGKEYQLRSDQNTYHKNCDFLSTGGVTIGFSPVAVIDSISRKAMTCILGIHGTHLDSYASAGDVFDRYTENFTFDTLYLSYQPSLNDSSRGFNVSVVNGEYIMSNKLTYNPPFKYSINRDTSFSFTVYLDPAINFTYGRLSLDPSDSTKNLTDGGFLFAESLNDTPTLTESIQINLPSLYPYSSSLRYQGYNYRREASYKEYPFTYLLMTFANKEIPIVPTNGVNSYTVTIDYMVGAFRVYRLRSNIGEEYIFRCSEIDGDLGSIYSQKESYEMHNQNRITARYLGGLIDSVRISENPKNLSAKFLPASSALTMAGNLISTAISQEALLADLSNYPDAVEGQSLNPLSRYMLYDDIAIIDCMQDVSDNQLDVEEALNKIHVFGKETMLYMNPFSIRRDTFDYMESDITNKIVSNNNDDRELKNAFLNGVHLWHISSQISDERMFILSKMSFAQNNFPISIL